MPNNNLSKPLLLKGSITLLEAALKEVQQILTLKKVVDTGSHSFDALVIDTVNSYWWSNKGNQSHIWSNPVLTLPQDWDKLMDILEELKKPQVPEYVKHRGGKCFKVHTLANYTYQGYNAYGQNTSMSVGDSTPITEEEFIQGGLKELEEAGFVVGARVTGLENPVTHIQYTTKSPLLTQSFMVDKEVEEKGFAFALFSSIKGNNSIPVGQCTLSPKAPQFPTTSQGIPYSIYKDKVILGVGPKGEGKAIHQGAFTYWNQLGVSSITLPCGTLTQEDLTTLASL